jgi:hypothetical protein
MQLHQNGKYYYSSNCKKCGLVMQKLYKDRKGEAYKLGLYQKQLLWRYKVGYNDKIKADRAQSPEKYRASERRRYINNPESKKIANRKSSLKRRNKIAEYQRKYFNETKLNRYAYQKKYRGKNIDKLKSLGSLSYIKTKLLLTDGYIKKKLRNKLGVKTKYLPNDFIALNINLYKLKHKLKHHDKKLH